MRAVTSLIGLLVVVGGVGAVIWGVLRPPKSEPERGRYIPDDAVPRDTKATYELLTRFDRFVGDLLVEDNLSPIMSQQRRDAAQQLVDEFRETIRRE